MYLVNTSRIQLYNRGEPSGPCQFGAEPRRAQPIAANLISKTSLALFVRVNGCWLQ